MKRRKWRKTLAVALSALFVLGIGVLAYVPWRMTNKLVDGHIDFKTTYAASDFGVEAERIDLTTEDGLKLAAWRVDADQPRAAVVFVSGVHGPSVTIFFGHAAMLRKAGYSSVLVEMRAHGESEGDTIGLGVTEYLDVRAAVRYIKESAPDLPVVAFGGSMGAAAAIIATAETPEIDAVISLSANSSWPDMFTDNMEQTGIPRALCAIEEPFVWLYMGGKYGFDKLHLNPLDAIRRLDGRPALLMHSTGDTVVPFKSFERLVAAAPEAETYVVEGNQHDIHLGSVQLPEEDAAYAGAILSFLERHFGP